MAKLTIRDVPTKVVKTLKTLFRRNRRSMEQEVHAVFEQKMGDRVALFDEIERSWAR
jgi:plasmid stability protein